jgi:hypothetical protein
MALSVYTAVFTERASFNCVVVEPVGVHINNKKKTRLNTVRVYSAGQFEKTNKIQTRMYLHI